MATTAVGNRESFKNALGKWNKKQDSPDVKRSSKKSLHRMEKDSGEDAEMDIHEIAGKARRSKSSHLDDGDEDLGDSSSSIRSLGPLDKIKSKKPKTKTTKKTKGSTGDSSLSPKRLSKKALDLNSYHGPNRRKVVDDDDDLRSQSEHKDIRSKLKKTKTKSKKEQDEGDSKDKAPRGYRRKYGEQKHAYSDEIDIQRSRSDGDGELHDSSSSMGSTRSLGARRNSKKSPKSSNRKTVKRQTIGTEGEMELKDSASSRREKARHRHSEEDKTSSELNDLPFDGKPAEEAKKSKYEFLSASTGNLGSGLSRRKLKETLFGGGGGKGYVEMEDDDVGSHRTTGRKQKSKSTDDAPFGSRVPRSSRQSADAQRPKAYSTAGQIEKNDDDEPEGSQPRVRRRRSLVDRISVFEKSPKDREEERLKSKDGIPKTPDLSGPRRGRSIESKISAFQSPKRDDSGKKLGDSTHDSTEVTPRRRRRSQEIKERMSNFESKHNSAADDNKTEDTPSPRRRRSLELAQRMSKFESEDNQNGKGPDGLPGAPELANPRRRKSLELVQKMAAFEKSSNHDTSGVKGGEEKKTPTRPKRNLVDRLARSGTRSSSDIPVGLQDDSEHDGEPKARTADRKPVSRRAVSDSNLQDEEEIADSKRTSKTRASGIAGKVEKLTEEDNPKANGTPNEPARRSGLSDRINKFNNKDAPPAFLGFVSPRLLKKKVKMPGQGSPSKTADTEQMSPRADEVAAKPRHSKSPTDIPSPPMSGKNGGLGNRIKAFDKSNGSSPFATGRATLKKVKKVEGKNPATDKKSLLEDETGSTPPEKDKTPTKPSKHLPKKVPLAPPSSEEKPKEGSKEEDKATRKRPPGKRGVVRRKSSGLLNKMGNVTTASLGDMTMFVPPTFHKDHTDETLIEKALRRNFVFDDLNERALKVFIAAFEECRFSKDDKIIKQGDSGDFFYVIARGKVRYLVDGSDVGSADVGMSFGELSLLYTCPRTATVRAESNPTKLFRVDQKTFRFIMQKMSRKLNQDKLDLLKKIKFLANLVESDLNKLSAVMVPRKFIVGDRIIHKGDVGDAFYIIQAGELSVTDISFGKTKYEDITLGHGDHFGERALVTNELAAANVVALSSGTLFSIEKATFEKVLGDYSRAILRSVDKFQLEGIKYFRDHELQASDYDQLATFVADMTLSKKKKIIVEGKETKAALYLVREGTVKITTNDFKRSDRIMAGGCFGQEHFTVDTDGGVDTGGLITPDYTATVYSDECVVGVLYLSDCRTVFDTTRKVGGETIFNQCQTFLDRRATVRESIKTNLPLEGLTQERILGEGQFAEVWLVTTKVDLGPDASDLNNKFALKVQMKDDPNRQDCMETIQREISVLSKMDHPFIIELFHTYEDDVNISMLTKAVFGGELWSVIHQEDDEGNWHSGLTEDHSKFYALNIADTIAYMHRKTIVFRDLKPENVLVDKEGYPIIVDFGFAKYCPDKTFTFCGTPNYVSPEIVMNRGHGFGADHWALGILIYEMTTGENPFYADGMDNMTLFQSIVQEDYYPLPETKTPELKSILDGLLEKDPAERLGVLQGGEKDILTHKWFDGLDLVKLRAKGVTAPFIPDAKEE